ncbi:MAG: CPBP family intramembrane glutamic endopeptidase [Pseudomonadota bacterium]
MELKSWGKEKGLAWAVESWRRTDELYLPAGPKYRGLASRTAVTVALSLTLINYFGFQPTFDWLGRPRFFPGYADLSYFAFWSGVRFLGYVILPALSLRFLTSIPLSEMGLGLKKAFVGWEIYLVLYLALVPVLVAAVFLPEFTTMYPFYKEAGRSWRHFLLWEFFYGLQFFSLEFFFRGYMIHTLKRVMGAMAVPMMIIPYCMIHFPKPLPECLGSIVAGLALGTLSLGTGKIWGGVFLHVAVALTMDVLALLRRAGFF